MSSLWISVASLIIAILLTIGIVLLVEKTPRWLSTGVIVGSVALMGWFAPKLVAALGIMLAIVATLATVSFVFWWKEHRIREALFEQMFQNFSDWGEEKPGRDDAVAEDRTFSARLRGRSATTRIRRVGMIRMRLDPRFDPLPPWIPPSSAPGDVASIGLQVRFDGPSVRDGECIFRGADRDDAAWAVSHSLERRKIIEASPEGHTYPHGKLEEVVDGPVASFLREHPLDNLVEQCPRLARVFFGQRELSADLRLSGPQSGFWVWSPSRLEQIGRREGRAIFEECSRVAERLVDLANDFEATVSGHSGAMK